MSLEKFEQFNNDSEIKKEEEIGGDEIEKETEGEITLLDEYKKEMLKNGMSEEEVKTAMGYRKTFAEKQKAAENILRSIIGNESIEKIKEDFLKKENPQTDLDSFSIKKDKEVENN